MSASSTSDDDNDENRLNLTESQLLAAQKSLISKHPLFPVLVYVLERCEQATLNPPLLTSTGEENSSNSFEQNLKVFLAKNPTLLTTLKDDEQDETSALIDSFYIDAMQVLRIHLLELDKVNDLCRDFCQRYIACLKVKLNANNIFTDDEDEEEDDEDDDDEIDAEFDDAESNLDDDFESSDDDEQLMFNAKASSRKPTMFNENANHFTGQTPLSQIIGTSSTVMADSSSSMLFESFCTKRRKTSANLSASKRGVLPKSATSIMRSWLFQHIVHPYPTEDEKRAISQKTNLSLLQVNNWFINARRRILQPMLEASNPDLAANKKKKRPSDSTADEHGAAATQNRQMSNINRYWPANLVQFDLTTTTSEQRKK